MSSSDLSLRITSTILMTLPNIIKMPRSMSSALLLVGLISAAASVDGYGSESGHFLSFIRVIDPREMLGIATDDSKSYPCFNKVKGVRCSEGTIVQIRLENLNLSGKIDANSICRLPNLRVLNLARNNIQGSIPHSIKHCTKLTHLNLSHNNLSGKVPLVLHKLRYLRKLDISNNHFTTITPQLKKESKYINSLESRVTQKYTFNVGVKADNSDNPSPVPFGSEIIKYDNEEAHEVHKGWIKWMILALGGAVCLVFSFFVCKRAAKLASKKHIQKPTQKSPVVAVPATSSKTDQPEKALPELVFFNGEDAQFKVEDLLEATADLRNHNICSSLFMVMLNNKHYAIKTMRKMQISLEEFRKTLRAIGNLQHPNILPLVGYYSANEERLLIYNYLRNGSLQDLLENSIEGKRVFPWRLRVSIANGIARGLGFIHQRSNTQESIPHGNLKPSNILLNENDEPQISEYGITKFLDPNRACLLPSKGYRAPEKKLSEKADVFSYGIILLELLTGKSVAKSGINLPKWVRAKVREEWTCEVFDEEVAQNAEKWAFSLLIIAMDCVSHYPEGRPTMAEALEKIEEVMNAVEDYDERYISPASFYSDASGPSQPYSSHRYDMID